MRDRGRAALAGVLVVSGVLALAGCGHDSRAEAPEAEEAVTLGPENIYVVRTESLQSGPVISGSLVPERQAVMRAQVAGPIVATSAEVGQQVHRGELLLRIDDTAIRDSYLSAKATVASAQQAAELAKRNAERSERLAKAGAIAEADLESARSQAASAASQLADAEARLALARKQLDQTMVRAPLDGIVSERPVDAGDVVQPGAALITVVDPSSMKLEAAVPAQEIGSIVLGQHVEFEVRGYQGRAFQGTVRRISPVADPATRQVGITVSIPNSGRDLVGGLYAEGRVQTQSAQGLAVPTAAVLETGGPPAVMRLKQGKAEQVPVQLGLRDERSEMVLVSGNIAAGDTLLLGAAQGVTPGTAVRVQPSAEVGGAAAGDPQGE